VVINQNIGKHFQPFAIFPGKVGNLVVDDWQQLEKQSQSKAASSFWQLDHLDPIFKCNFNFSN